MKLRKGRDTEQEKTWTKNHHRLWEYIKIQYMPKLNTNYRIRIGEVQKGLEPFEISRAAIWKHFKAFEKEGKLELIRRGVYKIPEKSKPTLEELYEITYALDAEQFGSTAKNTVTRFYAPPFKKFQDYDDEMADFILYTYLKATQGTPQRQKHIFVGFILNTKKIKEYLHTPEGKRDLAKALR